MKLTPEMIRMLNEPEKKVANWLLNRKVPFDVQEPMLGGRTELGGLVVDFVITDRMIIIRVQGTYWHRTLEANARDELGRENLVQLGYAVVDVWEDNLSDDEIELTMTKALRGEERFR